MAGRPTLRIGAHGKIIRIQVGDGQWIARCRHRDSDGVTRQIERRTPDGVPDEYGAQAEAALLDALTDRRPAGAIAATTLIVDLLDRYIERAGADGELAPKTVDTYAATLAAVRPRMAGIRVGEADPGLLDDILRGIRRDHGATRERHTKVALNAVLTDAVIARAIPSNPVRELRVRRRRKGERKPAGAPQITMPIGDVIAAVQASEVCQRKDLADPVVLLAATGIRRSELLALRWADVDLEGRTIAVTGSVVRIKGRGLVRQDHTKGGTDRTLALPGFAVDMLTNRERTDVMVFPSSVGTLRDPDNMGKQWREVRDDLGLPDITSHSFRKTVATLLDDAGLSARVGADQLGHSRPSMTQDTYMARGRTHTAVADAIDRAAEALPLNKR